MSDIKGMGISRDETEEDAEVFLGNPNFVHFLGMISPPRPSVILCITKLEHEHYPPGTDINNDFVLRLRNWEQILWAIVSIPKHDFPIMENVAKELRLELVKGLPCVISKGKLERFPIKNSDNVWTFENSNDHPIHARKIAIEDMPSTIEELIKEEGIEIEKIFAKTEERTRKMKN
jgi:hypothetical protein